MSGEANKLHLPQIQPGMFLAERYRILSSIGKGGMGYVFAAQEESLGIKRMVAIKMLPPQMMLDEALAERFREEIKIASALDHPNIVPIYSLGEHQGVYFYVMKLLQGQNATQAMRAEGPFAEERVRRVMAPMARALHYAHTKGVTHRDVKSNNIHIGEGDFPTLMDFGIARGGEASGLTTTGQVVGTAEYMSPEQWYGAAEPRSDIYSLGVVMFELLTGQVPFKSKHPFELMKLHQEEQPPSPRMFVPNLSMELEGIVLKCLAKDPQARFGTALELAEALEKPFQPTAGEPAAGPVTVEESPTAETQSGGPSTAITELQRAPEAELTGEDQKVWSLCRQADEVYRAGEVEEALKIIHRARKLAPKSIQVENRLVKFTKMKELIDQIVARADKLLKDGKPREAILDYDNVLRCLPHPKVSEKITEARRRMEKAGQLVKKARQLRAKGKGRKAVRLSVEAIALDREVEAPTGPTGKPKRRPVRLATKRKKGKRASWITKTRVLTALVVLLAVGAIFGSRPLLLYLGDRTYAGGDERQWFLSPLSAYHFYSWADKLGATEPRIEVRLGEIHLRARNYYVEQANEAIANKDYGAAVEHLKMARQHAPRDTKLRERFEELNNKYQVQRSMRKK